MLWPSIKKMIARKTTNKNSLVPNVGGFGSCGSVEFPVVLNDHRHTPDSNHLPRSILARLDGASWRKNRHFAVKASITHSPHRFSPLHRPPLPAALVRQHLPRASSVKSLLRRDIERRFLLDRIPHIRIKPAIISALRLHLHTCFAHQAQRAPQTLPVLLPNPRPNPIHRDTFSPRSRACPVDPSHTSQTIPSSRESENAAPVQTQ